MIISKWHIIAVIITDLQSLLVGQGAPPERVVLDAPGLHLEPVLLVLPLRRACLRRRKDSEKHMRGGNDDIFSN